MAVDVPAQAWCDTAWPDRSQARWLPCPLLPSVASQTAAVLPPPLDQREISRIVSVGGTCQASPAGAAAGQPAGTDRRRVTVTAPDRIGQHAGEDAASFRCAACGEMAAVVKVVPAGRPADMGPPLGRQSRRRDGIVVDYFGGTAWKLAEAPVYRAVREILNGERPDPAALRRIDWELAPFYCPDCGQNYCRADWRTHAASDQGSYDRTMGRCPHGHRQMIDD